MTSEDLAGRLNLTRRMVRYHLDAAERWLTTKRATLTRKPHYGFEIEATREAKATLLRELKQVASEDIVLCPGERIHLVLLLLFTQEEPLLVKQLWTQFRVCRTTIFGDLDEAQEWLETHMLFLLRRANYGFQLMGQEDHIQPDIDIHQDKRPDRARGRQLHPHGPGLELNQFQGQEDILLRIAISDSRNPADGR